VTRYLVLRELHFPEASRSSLTNPLEWIVMAFICYAELAIPNGTWQMYADGMDREELWLKALKEADYQAKNFGIPLVPQRYANG
jgi:hypothetical protein